MGSTSSKGFFWSSDADVGAREACAAAADRARYAKPECVHRIVQRAATRECLNKRWFTSLAHARIVIEAWRREYNEA